MTKSFVQQMKEIPDHLGVGMVTYRLDEILLATLVGVLCGADDWDAIELLSREYVPWLKQFLPYKHGVAKAQTFRKVFRLLKPEVLSECFGAWVASLQDVVRGVVAIVLRHLSAPAGRRRRSAQRLSCGSRVIF